MAGCPVCENTSLKTEVIGTAGDNVPAEILYFCDTDWYTREDISKEEHF